MKKDKLRRPPTAVLIVMIALVVIVGTTVAWLTVGTGTLDRNLFLSNFDTEAVVWFEGGSMSQNADKTISVDVGVDPNAANYIGKLRVNAKFTGRGQAYLRVKMVQQWTDGDGTILQSNVLLPYNISTPYNMTTGGNQSAWFDNRMDDYCLYYAKKLTSVVNGTYETIPVIIADPQPAQFASKLAAVIPQGNVNLKIAIILEAVQVNRYPQFWGINTLPWPEA